MGQKVNQSIFRLGVNDFNWNYKYLEKNPEESSLLLYKNVSIVNYINNLLNFYGILVHSCKIEYNKTSINVIIYFFFVDLKLKGNYNEKKIVSHIITQLLPIGLKLYTKTNVINIKTKNLTKIFDITLNKSSEYNKSIKFLKKILNKKNYNSYKSLIKIMFITVLEKNSAKLLAECIAMYIAKYKKKHGYLLFILKKCFNFLVFSKFSKLKGLKIEIAGRINGAPRSKTKRVQIGAIPLQSFDSSVSYHNSTSYTLNGSFGVKVWICGK